MKRVNIFKVSRIIQDILLLMLTEAINEPCVDIVLPTSVSMVENELSKAKHFGMFSSIF